MLKQFQFYPELNEQLEKNGTLALEVKVPLTQKVWKCWQKGPEPGSELTFHAVTVIILG